MAPIEGRASERRAALRRQRALGSEDTKAAMKVLERYCKKKYRQSIVFTGLDSTLGLAEPHALQQETLGGGGHYHSEPFTPRHLVNRQFTFEQSTFSCPTDAKSLMHQYTVDFTEPTLKEEIRYQRGRETKTHYVLRVFKFLYDYLGIKHFLLLLLMTVYALAGGYMFYSIEGPAEIIRNNLRKNATILRAGNYSTRVLDLAQCNSTQRSDHDCNSALVSLFEDYDHELRRAYGLETAWKWDFWNAVFYSGTIFTTIGYGNISCRTMVGRIATCAYAFFGVPLMLVVLNSLGKGLFLSVQAFWEYMRKLVRRKFLRLRRNIRRTATVESVPAEDLLTIMKAEKEEEEEEEKDDTSNDNTEQDLFTTFPMSLALLTVFSYISICSWLFCYWENWDYPTAFYFFFISLSTVGLGDEMPEHPKRACAFFLFFIIGLALVSMCISILQVKVENKYMAALQLIDQEHLTNAALDEEEEEEQQDRFGEEEDDVRPLTTVPKRPERLPEFTSDTDIRWRRTRLDSRGSEFSSVPDRASRTASQILMHTPGGSPACPPPVLGVFMARSIRRPQSIIARTDSTGSKISRKHRAGSATINRSHEDMVSPGSSNKTVAWASSAENRVESPTGTKPLSPVQPTPPRQAVSLAVITEDLDEEDQQPPQSAPPATPATTTSPGRPLQPPVIKIDTCEDLPRENDGDENGYKDEKEWKESEQTHL